jgi:hypothetical protein
MGVGGSNLKRRATLQIEAIALLRSSGAGRSPPASLPESFRDAFLFFTPNGYDFFFSNDFRLFQGDAIR